MKIIRNPSHLFVCLAVACGGTFEPPGRFSDASRAATAATADSPGQAEVVTHAKVSFSGRSGAPAGANVAVVTFDAALVRRSCTATVAGDHTWTCTQTLADGGYSWSAQVAAGGPLSQEIDFVVNTHKYPAPTIDHLP